MRDETKKAVSGLWAKLREHKYAAIVLLAGLILLLLPVKGGEKSAPEPDAREQTAPSEEDLEARLEEVLSLIDGAGQVRVLLTAETDGERVLADESRRSLETDDGRERQEEEQSAVIVSGSGTQEAVEVSYRYPVYRGAVVAAQGADSAAVRLELLEAVRAATGLSSDAIRIVKLGQTPAQ